MGSSLQQWKGNLKLTLEFQVDTQGKKSHSSKSGQDKIFIKWVDKALTWLLVRLQNQLLIFA